MNIHSTLDHLYIGLRLLITSKFYREGDLSATFPEHLESIDLKMPPIHGLGEYEVTAKTLAGQMEAGFRIGQWKGERYPTIIFHHGAGEIPFDRSFRGIFPYRRKEIPANLVLVRAAYHRSSKEFSDGNRTLSGWVAMLATSVSLIEKLVSWSREKQASFVLVAGTSMGGQIANLHHVYSNTADVYTPLLSGTVMGDGLLDSASRFLVASGARKNAARVKKILNFEEEFLAADNRNVFPLLSRFDVFIRYEEHRRCYDGRPLVTLNRGHLTGAFSFSSLREHILEQLP